MVRRPQKEGMCGLERGRSRDRGQRLSRATARPAAWGNEREAVLRDRDRGEVADRPEACEGLALELTHALASEAELGPDRLERPRIAFEPEAQLEDATLALGKRIERLAD